MKLNKGAVLENERARRQKWRTKLRAELRAAYGGKCACCPVDDPACLSIDHKFDDGALDRSSEQLYIWLRKNNWPKDRYQLLCMNCQFKKRQRRRREDGEG